MDTTKIEIVGSNLDKIIESVVLHQNGLTSGQVALIAAAIGASAAIFAQLIIFLLTRYKEKANLKKELIADERRLAFLLTELYKEVVMHKVHKQYWYKCSELRNEDKEDSKDSHERHFLSNQKAFKALAKIRVTTSEYFKVVTHYTNLTGQNEIITKGLNDIRAFEPRKASTFENVSTYSELLQQQAIEERELNKVYLFYSRCYDQINCEMIAK